MKWRIDYSRNADKFIRKHNARIKVSEEIKKFLKKIKGEEVNIDLSKLSGEWKGYYRLRKGKLRIIFEVSKSARILFVEKIDFRGDVYQ